MRAKSADLSWLERAWSANASSSSHGSSFLGVKGSMENVGRLVVVAACSDNREAVGTTTNGRLMPDQAGLFRDYPHSMLAAAGNSGVYLRALPLRLELNLTGNE